MTQTEFTGEDNEFEYKGYNILVFRNLLNYNIFKLLYVIKNPNLYLHFKMN